MSSSPHVEALRTDNPEKCAVKERAARTGTQAPLVRRKKLPLLLTDLCRYFTREEET